MAEWWEVWSSYRPSDFLMFSPGTYWRLVELHNRAAWPLHLLVLALGSVFAWALWRGHRWAPRVLLLLSALAWSIVAWGWHLQRYAAINWAATWLASAFALQAGLWVIAAALAQQGAAVPVSVRRWAVALLGAALLAYPLLGPALGRPWAQAETLAMSPDPTLLASLAALLVARRVWLWPIPLLGCALSGLTLWTMDEPLQALLLPTAALVALVVSGVSVVAGRRDRRLDLQHLGHRVGP
ncbi:MAG TPA: DUF6064 family protein [Rubrivivax sp.]|nr:DUF6064 family protein [Rubrivivax sp.]